MGSAALSELFWGVDLGAGLPRLLSEDGICAERGEIGRIGAFLQDEFPFFAEEQPGALDERIAATKRWYLSAACDLLELRQDGATVGVMVGAPEDWSTYYLRLFAVSQRCQRRGLTRRFFNECVAEPLQSRGVERVVADTSPANLAMAHTFAEQRFYATGQLLTERWGPMIRYTRFLQPARRDAFTTKFGGTAPPRQRG